MDTYGSPHQALQQTSTHLNVTQPNNKRPELVIHTHHAMRGDIQAEVARKSAYSPCQNYKELFKQANFHEPKLSRDQQTMLANALKEIIFIQRDIESAKIDLALKQDFNLFDAFRIFDTKNTGSITSQDLVDGLRMNLEFRDFTH